MVPHSQRASPRQHTDLPAPSRVHPRTCLWKDSNDDECALASFRKRYPRAHRTDDLSDSEEALDRIDNFHNESPSKSRTGFNRNHGWSNFRRTIVDPEYFDLNLTRRPKKFSVPIRADNRNSTGFTEYPFFNPTRVPFSPPKGNLVESAQFPRNLDEVSDAPPTTMSTSEQFSFDLDIQHAILQSIQSWRSASAPPEDLHHHGLKYDSLQVQDLSPVSTPAIDTPKVPSTAGTSERPPDFESDSDSESDPEVGFQAEGHSKPPADLWTSDSQPEPSWRKARDLRIADRKLSFRRLLDATILSSDSEYEIVPNPGGGSCFFHCVSQSLRRAGLDVTTDEVRTVLANSLTSDDLALYRIKYEASLGLVEETHMRWFIGIESLEDLREAVLLPSYWADDLAIGRLSLLLSLRLVILNTTSLQIACGVVPRSVPHTHYLLLHYSGDESTGHYQLITYRSMALLSHLPQPFYDYMYRHCPTDLPSPVSATCLPHSTPPRSAPGSPEAPFSPPSVSPTPTTFSSPARGLCRRDSDDLQLVDLDE